MRVLLTGAGFSRNWGGWLASEAFEYLLGAPEVDDELRRLLWADHARDRGFEDTLADLQQNAGRDTSALRMRDTLTAALVGMFNQMDGAFAGVPFEWQTTSAPGVGQFLTGFDAIFTLNQDRLLERHYLNDNVALSPSRRWDGYQLPGLVLANPASQGVPEPARNLESWKPDDTGFHLEPRLQPYFKLHGSSNFLGDGGRILIMGGNKEAGVRQSSLLSWYHEQFVEHLARAERLMIIGYSFRDEHINTALSTAVSRGSLKLFIIDPLGVDILQRERRNVGVRVTDPLIEQLGPSVAGASRRSLGEIFGRDQVELGKLLRFLGPA